MGLDLMAIFSDLFRISSNHESIVHKVGERTSFPLSN